MNLPRIFSTVFVITGIVLLCLGVAAMDSFRSDMSRFFTGTPTDKAVWMMIGGLVTLAIGTSGFFKGRSKS